MPRLPPKQEAWFGRGGDDTGDELGNDLSAQETPYCRFGQGAYYAASGLEIAYNANRR
jgi:hypothetical protein